jgi:hypothetical protein
MEGPFGSQEPSSALFSLSKGVRLMSEEIHGNTISPSLPHH